MYILIMTKMCDPGCLSGDSRTDKGLLYYITMTFKPISNLNDLYKSYKRASQRINGLLTPVFPLRPLSLAVKKQ